MNDLGVDERDWDVTVGLDLEAGECSDSQLMFILFSPDTVPL